MSRAIDRDGPVERIDANDGFGSRSSGEEPIGEFWLEGSAAMAADEGRLGKKNDEGRTKAA